jgi:hypothetical protein
MEEEEIESNGMKILQFCRFFFRELLNLLCIGTWYWKNRIRFHILLETRRIRRHSHVPHHT